LSRLEWIRIGYKAGWLKTAEYTDFTVVNPDEVRGILDSFGSQRFWIGYRKQNGEFREMECQRGVDKMSDDPTHLPSPEYQQMLQEKGLIVVYDLKEARSAARDFKEQGLSDNVAKLKAMRKAYRRIYPQNIEVIHGGGHEYIVSTATEPWVVEKIEQTEHDENPVMAKTAGRLPAWAHYGQNLSEQAQKYSDIIHSVGVGYIKENANTLESKIEFVDETLGTAYIEVYLDFDAETPAVVVEKYYESEALHNRWGKKVSVAIDLDNVEASASLIRKAMKAIIER